MQYLHKSILAVIIIATSQALSCRPASYEIIGNKAKDSGAPHNFGEPQVPANQPPQAQVETIYQGKSVTAVPAGQTVEIRPSTDTADGDDVGHSSCINPGIVSVTYEVNKETKTVSRTNGCEPLGISYTFASAGVYSIKMIVTTNEGETAESVMNLTVESPGQNSPGQNPGQAPSQSR